MDPSEEPKSDYDRMVSATLQSQVEYEKVFVRLKDENERLWAQLETARNALELISETRETPNMEIKVRGGYEDWTIARKALAQIGAGPKDGD
jgi:hypothetical protein